jgi:hypothetical protein
MLMPHATARKHSLDHIARPVVLMATSEEKHAVSLVKYGLIKPKLLLIAPLRYGREVPTVAQAVGS